MATVKIVLDDRKGNTESYIKLRVTHDRQSKYYPCRHKRDAENGKAISDELDLDRKFTKAEFDRVLNATRRTDKEREYWQAYLSFQTKAQNVINGLPVFTWEAFEEQYTKKRGERDSLKALFEAKIATLEKAGQIGNAANYKCAMNSFELFKTGIKLAGVTSKFLSDYTEWMLKKGRSRSSISMYTRALRALINEQIAEGKFAIELYPFRRNRSERKKYAPPAAKNTKKALEPEQIAKLYYAQPLLRAQQQAVDFWKFSYLCNGMNMADILNIRWRDIDGDYLHFKRKKTAETKSEETEITVHLKADAWQIIKRFGIRSINPESRVFPVLKEDMIPAVQHRRTQTFILNMNKNLKKVCKAIGIPPITSYSARHSFASMLKWNNTSVEMISESLGHSSIATTKNYLKSFANERIKEATEILIPQRLVN